MIQQWEFSSNVAIGSDYDCVRRSFSLNSQGTSNSDGNVKRLFFQVIFEQWSLLMSFSSQECFWCLEWVLCFRVNLRREVCLVNVDPVNSQVTMFKICNALHVWFPFKKKNEFTNKQQRWWPCPPPALGWSTVTAARIPQNYTTSPSPCHPTPGQRPNTPKRLAPTFLKKETLTTTLLWKFEWTHKLHQHPKFERKQNKRFTTTMPLPNINLRGSRVSWKL